MRKITITQTLIFITLLTATICLAAGTVFLFFDGIRWAGEFRAIISTLVFLVSFLAYSVAVYRILLSAFALPAAYIAPNSREEAIYHVHLLFFLMIFYPVMKSNLVPVPIMRLIYQGLGAKLGENTYSGGVLFDPIFVNIGSNTIVGQGALLIPHVLEGTKLAHFPIRIGSNVTIGANAVILSDVEIGDGATVAIGAVVTKGSRIGKGEVWGGLPAKKLS